MKSIYLLFGVLFLISCSDLKRPEQLNKLEVIDIKLSELKTLKSGVNYDSIQIVVDEITNSEERMKVSFQDDTLSLQLIKKLDEYKRIKPSLVNVLEVGPVLDSSINSNKERVDLLVEDIKNGVGNRAKYDTNISFEEKAIFNLSEFVNYCDSVVNHSFETFHILHQEVLSFVLKLEEQNKEQ